MQLLTLEVAVGDTETVVTTKFQQSLSVLVHPADTEVTEAGWPSFPVSSIAGVEVA